MAPPKKPKAAPAAAAAVLDMALLATIVTATRVETHPFTFGEPADLKALADAGYVELRTDMTEASMNEGPSTTKVAVRATETGMAASDAYVPPAAPPAPAAAPASPFGAAAPAPAAAPVAAPAAVVMAGGPAAAATPAAAPEAIPSTFKVLTGLPIPAAKRFGKASVYPFDSLAVGACFVVPASTERPSPAKSLASTVNSANGRYATVDAAGKVNGYTKHFVLRNVPDGEPYGHPKVKCAVVWRDK